MNIHADGSIGVNTPQNSFDPQSDKGFASFLLYFPVHGFTIPQLEAFRVPMYLVGFGGTDRASQYVNVSIHSGDGACVEPPADSLGIVTWQAAADATIIMGNQSQFDGAAAKLRTLADRRPGEAHPLELGAAAVARYFKIEDECAQAVRLRLLGQQHGASQLGR